MIQQPQLILHEPSIRHKNKFQNQKLKTTDMIKTQYESPSSFKKGVILSIKFPSFHHFLKNETRGYLQVDGSFDSKANSIVGD